MVHPLAQQLGGGPWIRGPQDGVAYRHAPAALCQDLLEVVGRDAADGKHRHRTAGDGFGQRPGRLSLAVALGGGGKARPEAQVVGAGIGIQGRLHLRHVVCAHAEATAPAQDPAGFIRRQVLLTDVGAAGPLVHRHLDVVVHDHPHLPLRTSTDAPG